MANRFPLTLISTTVSELPSGDALDLTGSNVYNNGAVITLPTTTGTLATLANTETLTNKTLTNPVINNIKFGIDQIATAASTTTLTVSSNHQQRFTGSTTQTVVMPVTSTLVAGMTYAIENSSTGNITVNSSGGNLIATVIPGTTMDFTCIGTSLTTAADWDAEVRAFATITGTGACVLAVSPSLTTPNIGAATGTSLSVSGSLTSTVATGTAPLTVTSTTMVSNLNVDYLDGQHGSYYTTAGNLSGTIPSAVLGNSTHYIGTTAVALNRGSANLALTGISSVTLPGSTSGTIQVTPAAVAGTGTVITLPATTGTVVTTGDSGTVTSTMIADGTIINADINASAAIAVSKLAASTISGVTLGNNLNTLTLNVSGTGLSGSTTYNGSAAATFTVTSNATSTNTVSAIVARDGSGNFTAGSITATAFTETSDERLKTNIVQLSNALDIVHNLHGKSFVKDGKASIGLIAQEVNKVLPQVVSVADDDMKTMSVQYGNIVAVLIEAIKEQQKQIEDLKAKVGN